MLSARVTEPTPTAPAGRRPIVSPRWPWWQAPRHEASMDGPEHQGRMATCKRKHHTQPPQICAPAQEGTRAHPDLSQGPADLQSTALTTELCTHLLMLSASLTYGTC